MQIAKVLTADKFWTVCGRTAISRWRHLISCATCWIVISQTLSIMKKKQDRQEVVFSCLPCGKGENIFCAHLRRDDAVRAHGMRTNHVPFPSKLTLSSQ